MKLNLTLNGLILLVLLSLNGYLSAQENSSCRLLEALIRNEEIQRLFFLNKFKDLPIVFVDPKHIVGVCTIANYNERVVQVVSDSSYLNKKGVQYIIIEKVKKNKHSYILTISHNDTGAAGDIIFRKKNKAMKVSKILIGYY